MLLDQNLRYFMPLFSSVPRKMTEWPCSLAPMLSFQKIFRKSPGRALERSVKFGPSPSS